MLPPHAAAGLSVQISLPDALKLVFQTKVLFSGFFRFVRDTRANPPNLLHWPCHGRFPYMAG